MNTYKSSPMIMFSKSTLCAPDNCVQKSAYSGVQIVLFYVFCYWYLLVA